MLPYEPYLPTFTPAVVGVVRPDVRGADARAGRRVAGDPVRQGRTDRRADRLGQDAGGVSRRDRRAGARRRAVGLARRDAHRLRLAAEGAVERHQSQSRSAARRHSRASCASTRSATSRSAPGCAPATRRSTNARRCGASRRTSSSRRRSRCTSCSARSPGREMLATTRTVIVDEIHAVAGSKRGAHLALSLERLRCADRPAADAHRLVGDAEADRRSRALPGRRAAASMPQATLDCTHRRQRPRAPSRPRDRTARRRRSKR